MTCVHSKAFSNVLLKCIHSSTPYKKFVTDRIVCLLADARRAGSDQTTFVACLLFTYSDMICN